MNKGLLVVGKSKILNQKSKINFAGVGFERFLTHV